MSKTLLKSKKNTDAKKTISNIYPAQQIADHLISRYNGHPGIDFEYCAIKSSHTRKINL